MPPNKPVHPLISLRIKYRGWYDAISTTSYLFLVYGWGLFIHPLGRDYPLMATMGEGLPTVTRHFFAWEVRTFGNHTVYYHLVNLLLLYLCMLCLYKLANLTIKGLWWFGTLAACLFMAHPVHSEALLNLSGSADLIPCLAGLFTLMVYTGQIAAPRHWKLVLAYGSAIATSLLFPQYATLPFVFVVCEVLVGTANNRSLRRMFCSALLGVVAVYFAYHDVPEQGPWYLRFVPLYFFIYPIGFLPETLADFAARPWTAYVAAAAFIGLLALIYRKARRSAILYALIAIVLLRLGPTERPIDLVHMIGGGQLLLTNAIFTIGLVALFFRIMEHPRWRISMVGITTSLVIVMFLTEFASVRRWREAGLQVAEFQAQAQAFHQEHPDEVLGVLPDFQYFHGAPMCLSQSIAHDTPYNTKIPAFSLLPMHGKRPKNMQTTVTSWSKDEGEVVVQGATPMEVIPNWRTLTPSNIPVIQLNPHGAVNAADAMLRVENIQADEFVIKITTPNAAPLPSTVLPGPVAPAAQ